MTRFLDGPAAGEVLMLRRAPDYLRAVQNALSGAWDALDQVDDTAGPTELVIVAYRRVGEPTVMHVDYTRRKSAWYVGGSYELVADQPADDVLRDTERWRAWCWERFDSILTADVRGVLAAIERGEGRLLPILADALEEAGSRDAELLLAMRDEAGTPNVLRAIRVYTERVKKIDRERATP